MFLFITPIKDNPLKGWVDNWYGITEVIHKAGLGWNRVTLGKGSNLVDLIPVDYVCNLTIVAAARCNKSKVTQVINCCTSSENPIKMSDIYKFIIQAYVASDKNVAPYPFHIITTSRAVFKILTIILEMAPAYIADCFLQIRGRKAKYVKNQLKLTRTRGSLEYFMTRSWVMKAGKSRELSSTLSHDDKLQFPCDPTDIRWKGYMNDYFHGLHRYLEPKNKSH